MAQLDPMQQQALKRLDRARPKIVYAVEPFLLVLEEMALAAYVNYNETGLDPEHLPYAPNWQHAAQFDASGDLVIVTARKRDKLIGYALGLVGKFKHSKDKVYADLDTIWVRPDERSGFVGWKLIKAWEKAIVENNPNVSFFTANSTHKKPIGVLLKKMGYVPIETVYYKYLGETNGK